MNAIGGNEDKQVGAAPLPSLQEQAIAAKETSEASSSLLMSSKSLAELSSMSRVWEVSDTFEKRLAAALMQGLFAMLIFKEAKDMNQDLAIEGRRGVQTVTTSNIILKAFGVLLALVTLVGGNYAVQSGLSAIERRDSINLKRTAALEEIGLKEEQSMEELRDE